MRRGYSILEILMAIAILSIALPGLIKWVTASRQTQIGSFRSEQATECAQSLLDSLRDLPRTSRTPVSDYVVQRNGMTYKLTWGYVSDPPYSGKIPGAAFLELQWPSGKANRVSRLDGVLP